MDKLGEEARFDQSSDAKRRATSSLAMKHSWAVVFLGGLVEVVLSHNKYRF